MPGGELIVALLLFPLGGVMIWGAIRAKTTLMLAGVMLIGFAVLLVYHWFRNS